MADENASQRKRVRRWLTWTLSFLLVVSATPAASAGPVAEQSGVVVLGANRSDLKLLGQAAARFEAHGLQLPWTVVDFNDGEQDCRGHAGLFSPGSGLVRICDRSEWVIVHELAHAWTEANVDEETKRRYLELRDLPEWDSHDVAWNKRGIEDSAFVITQILRVGPGPERSAEWAERRAAFELLVARSSRSDV